MFESEQSTGSDNVWEYSKYIITQYALLLPPFLHKSEEREKEGGSGIERERERARGRWIDRERGTQRRMGKRVKREIQREMGVMKGKKKGKWGPCTYNNTMK